MPVSRKLAFTNVIFYHQKPYSVKNVHSPVALTARPKLMHRPTHSLWHIGQKIGQKPPFSQLNNRITVFSYERRSATVAR